MAAAPFWRSFPRTSIAGFLLGVFFIFSAMGFLGDITEIGRMRGLRLGLSVLSSGLFAISYAIGFTLRKRFWMALIPIFGVQFGVAYMLSRWIPDLPQPAILDAAALARLQSRLLLDGVAVMAAIVCGYTCLAYVSITEGRRYARVHAEIVLATEIHRVLVPPIDMTIGRFEFCGRSLPSGEVGGDLIDVFEHGRGWIAYIADVSGHGVAPGVVMAMVKSAARMQLSSSEDSSDLFARLNAVLHPIKKPEMFVTFAYVAWDGEQFHHSLAGHPPILHYHSATGQVSEVSCSNLPIGMFAGQQFANAPLAYAPGDRFLLVTDGLLETINSNDEQFGLARVASAFSQHAHEPAHANLEAILDAASRFGHTDDDRSLLLICA